VRKAEVNDATLNLRLHAISRGPAGGLSDESATLVRNHLDSPTTVAGACIGPYRLVHKLGEGGMGAVWLAEQNEPVKRKVALKLAKGDLDSALVVARFQVERQALALMEHPGIARVLDAGTTDTGRPFFVMELVDGVPITAFCDQRSVPLRARLELFVGVCLAVQHAHQKGIIHRDLKPTNILVALCDGKPVPKIIDFGIAKAMDQRLADMPFLTGFGSVVGSVEYMSPEQAESGQCDVDTRSDVYSLGVLLYELLTGTTPLHRQHIRDATLLQVLRLIHEQEPPRPSTRRGTAGALPAELDWVVMKCLEKDRERRCESASALAACARRWGATAVSSWRAPWSWWR
jgi:serine/threonine protein kinase